jgi:hypothetical protein
MRAVDRAKLHRALDAVMDGKRPEAFEYMLRRIQETETQRNWAGMPAGFEQAAVKHVYERGLRPYFGKAEIRHRVAASKATTFEELKRAIGA